MNWLYAKKYFDSEMNGRIEVRRFLGRYTVKVNGETQSAPYTDAMWRVALRHVTKNARVKHVLVLGLGGGSSLKAIFRKYPRAHVTILEWDRVMLDICRELHLLLHPEQVRIVIGDARESLKTLSQKFDLILFDLYNGNKISETVSEDQFLKSIAQHLAPNGYYLVNYWLHGKHVPRVEKYFAHQDTWRFRVNRFSLHRPALPLGYERYRSVSAFQRREARLQTRQIPFTTGKTHGLRSSIGPMHFEKYVGNTEPVIEPLAKFRIITWHPTSHTPKPAGWHRFPLRSGTKSYGLAHITNPDNYWSEWRGQARRHRKQWLEHDSRKWEITEITPESFYKAFARVKLGVGLVGILTRLVKYKVRYHGQLVKFYGARKKDSQEIQAGLVVLHIPEAVTSLHLAAFHLPSAKQTSVGTGLMDTWYREAIAQNISYLDFGVIRANREPRDWQGFSDFKNQFLTHTVFTPKPFFKITW